MPIVLTTRKDFDKYKYQKRVALTLKNAISMIMVTIKFRTVNQKVYLPMLNTVNFIISTTPSDSYKTIH